MITKIAHVCLKVASLERTIEFYGRKLGIPVKFTFIREGKAIGVYFEVGPGNFIEAFQGREPGLSNTGISHFCLETDDMDGFIAEMKSKGIECTEKTLGCEETWQTWLKDPDGNSFEVHQYTGKSAQSNGGSVQVSW